MGRFLGDVEDSKYLGIGKHRVRVSGTEMTQSKEGKPCVSYTFRDMEGATSTKKLSLQTNALWKLKTLICALGLPKESLAVFDVDSANHHNRMVGKELWIELTPGDGKYPELETWWSVAGKTEQAVQKAQGTRTVESLKEINDTLINSAIERLAQSAPANDDDIPF